MIYPTKIIIYLLIILCGSIFGILMWNRTSPAFKKITLLLIITCITETFALAILNFIDTNIIVYTIFDPIQVLVIAYIFSDIFDSHKLKKGARIAGIIISLCVILISVLKFYSLTNNLASSIVLKSFFYLTLSLLKYREMLLNITEDDILKDPIFWFVTSLLFFNAINIMFWITYSSLQTKVTRNFAKSILLYSNYLFYGLIAGCFLLIYKKQKWVYDK